MKPLRSIDSSPSPPSRRVAIPDFRSVVHGSSAAIFRSPEFGQENCTAGGRTEEKSPRENLSRARNLSTRIQFSRYTRVQRYTFSSLFLATGPLAVFLSLFTDRVFRGSRLSKGDILAGEPGSRWRLSFRVDFPSGSNTREENNRFLRERGSRRGNASISSRYISQALLRSFSFHEPRKEAADTALCSIRFDCPPIYIYLYSARFFHFRGPRLSPDCRLQL